MLVAILPSGLELTVVMNRPSNGDDVMMTSYNMYILSLMLAG